MTNVASVEAIQWKNKDVASTIDERMLVIAQRMPREPFYWILGEEYKLFGCEGIGDLHCKAVGRYSVALYATIAGYDGQLGFIKEYTLVKRHTEPERLDQVHDYNPSMANEFDDCPYPNELVRGINTLHHEYLAHLATAATLKNENVHNLLERTYV